MPPGAVLGPFTLDETQLEERLRQLLRPSPGEAAFVWRNVDEEAVVHAGATRAKVLQGLVLVGIVLEIAQRPVPSTLTVPFAVATRKDPAGMVMAGERQARGDQLLVDGWGKAAVAASYRALLLAAGAVAAAAGWDRDGMPLVSGAVAAEPHRLNVWAQARFESDRVTRP